MGLLNNSSCNFLSPFPMNRHYRIGLDLNEAHLHNCSSAAISLGNTFLEGTGLRKIG